MQTRLQDFNSFSIGLLSDLQMSEQQQNKVKTALKDYNMQSHLPLFGTLNYEYESNTFQLDFHDLSFFLGWRSG